MPRPTNSNVLGGPFNGYSAIQTVNNYRNTSDVTIRSVLRRGWNTSYARGAVNGHNRIVTPFRAVNNSGDFLSRQNYVCGGSSPAPSGGMKPGMRNLFGSIISNCDGTGVPASVCNVKFVADSSDYTRFKKEVAHNKVFNDVNFGGYQNSSQSVLPRVRA